MGAEAPGRTLDQVVLEGLRRHEEHLLVRHRPQLRTPFRGHRARQLLYRLLQAQHRRDLELGASIPGQTQQALAPLLGSQRLSRTDSDRPCNGVLDPLMLLVSYALP